MFYFLIEFSFLIKYYNLLYQSLIPNCKLTINTLRQHISISDNIEQYIVGAASHRTSCRRLINFLLTRLYSEKDYMQFCYHLNIISVLTDLPFTLITGMYVCNKWRHFYSVDWYYDVAIKSASESDSIFKDLRSKILYVMVCVSEGDREIDR